MNNTQLPSYPIQLKPLSGMENASRRAGAATVGALTGLTAYFATDALERALVVRGAASSPHALPGLDGAAARNRTASSPAADYVVGRALALPHAFTQFAVNNRFWLCAGAGLLCAALTYRWAARAVKYLQNRQHLGEYREAIVDNFGKMTPAQLQEQLNDATMRCNEFAAGTKNHADLTATRRTLMAALLDARLRGVPGAYL